MQWRAMCCFATARSAHSRTFAVDEFAAAIAKLKLTGREAEIGRDLLAELTARTAFLHDVGLGYLQLNRAATTLVRRRGAAHPARGAARLQFAGRVLCAR